METPMMISVPTSRRRGSVSAFDRFIPNRRNSDFEGGLHRILRSSPTLAARRGSTGSIPSPEVALQSAETSPSGRILAFHDSPKRPKSVTSWSSVGSLGSSSRQSPVTRRLPTSPRRVLDMPGLQPYPYCSLLSWSSRNNIAVVTGESVHLWNPVSRVVTKLAVDGFELDVTAVAWSDDGKYLAFGASCNCVYVYNYERSSPPQCLSHACEDPVTSITWDPTKPRVFYSGSSQGEIRRYDLRAKTRGSSRSEGHLFGLHEDGVCVLRVSPCGRYLATGGRDHCVRLWSVGQSRQVTALQGHQAPVQALAWSPWQASSLTTGCSSEDGIIIQWNVNNSRILNTAATAATVSDMLWSKLTCELVTGHAGGHHQVQVRRHSDLKLVGTMDKHNNDVLNLALDPTSKILVSLGADEKLMWWECFEEKPTPTRRASSVSTRSPLAATIR